MTKNIIRYDSSEANTPYGNNKTTVSCTGISDFLGRMNCKSINSSSNKNKRGARVAVNSNSLRALDTQTLDNMNAFGHNYEQQSGTQNRAYANNFNHQSKNRDNTSNKLKANKNSKGLRFFGLLRENNKSSNLGNDTNSDARKDKNAVNNSKVINNSELNTLGYISVKENNLCNAIKGANVGQKDKIHVGRDEVIARDSSFVTCCSSSTNFIDDNILNSFVRNDFMGRSLDHSFEQQSPNTEINKSVIGSMKDAQKQVEHALLIEYLQPSEYINNMDALSMLIQNPPRGSYIEKLVLSFPIITSQWLTDLGRSDSLEDQMCAVGIGKMKRIVMNKYSPIVDGVYKDKSGKEIDLQNLSYDKAKYDEPLPKYYKDKNIKWKMNHIGPLKKLIEIYFLAGGQLTDENPTIPSNNIVSIDGSSIDELMNLIKYLPYQIDTWITTPLGNKHSHLSLCSETMEDNDSDIGVWSSSTAVQEYDFKALLNQKIYNLPTTTPSHSCWSGQIFSGSNIDIPIVESDKKKVAQQSDWKNVRVLEAFRTNKIGEAKEVKTVITGSNDETDILIYFINLAPQNKPAIPCVRISKRI